MLGAGTKGKHSKKSWKGTTKGEKIQKNPSPAQTLFIKGLAIAHSKELIPFLPLFPLEKGAQGRLHPGGIQALVNAAASNRSLGAGAGASRLKGMMRPCQRDDSEKKSAGKKWKDNFGSLGHVMMHLRGVSLPLDFSMFKIKKRIMRNSCSSGQVYNKFKPKVCISPQLKNRHVQESLLQIPHMAPHPLRLCSPSQTFKALFSIPILSRPCSQSQRGCGGEPGPVSAPPLQSCLSLPKIPSPAKFH